MSDQDAAGPAPELTADQASLIAEADAALAGAPVDPLAPPAPDQAAPVTGEVFEPWTPFLKAAVAPTIFMLVVPQWNLPADLRNEWIESLGACLDQVLPGGPAGKYACWVRFALATLAAGGMTYITNGRKWPPLGPAALPKSDAAPAA